jgi:hypothetical protein
LRYTTASAFRAALEQRLVTLAQQMAVPLVRLRKAGQLRQALKAIFVARESHPLPAALSPPPPLWRTAYRKTAIEVGLDADIDAGYERVRIFLDPILAGTIPDASQWDPVQHKW